MASSTHAHPVFLLLIFHFISPSAVQASWLVSPLPEILALNVSYEQSSYGSESDLFARALSCSPGYHFCSQNTSPHVCCPTTYGCCPPSWCVPLDGSVCCSDGISCPPNSKCGACVPPGSRYCCYSSNGQLLTNPASGPSSSSIVSPPASTPPKSPSTSPGSGSPSTPPASGSQGSHAPGSGSSKPSGSSTPGGGPVTSSHTTYSTAPQNSPHGSPTTHRATVVSSGVTLTVTEGFGGSTIGQGPGSSHVVGQSQGAASSSATGGATTPNEGVANGDVRRAFVFAVVTGGLVALLAVML